MARGTGRENGRRRGKRADGKARSGRRPGRQARLRSKTEGLRGASPGGRREGGGPGEPGREREGIVREIDPPSAAGQQVRVEERSGARWQVGCPGEARDVGDRIAFVPLPAVAETAGAPPGGLPRGEMIRLLAARRTEWVCTLHESRAGLQLVPFGGIEAPDLSLARRDARDARDGDRVVVVPLSGKGRSGKRRSGAERGARSGRHRDRPVRVVEVLGPVGSPDADHRALVWKHRLPRDFPRRARIEAASVDEEMPEAELARRVDLRHLPFITIDPASARDHDDAVFAEERAEVRLERVSGAGAVPSEVAPAAAAGPRWAHRLWVAIADVSHFVGQGSAIDSEARRRGNSFYFPDRAIPMLPERLSSGVCSLRPAVDRLAVVAELRLLPDGQVGDALFHEAVIRSHARLAYEEAADWLSSTASSPSRGDDEPVWGESLRCLDRIATDLLRRRAEAGAVLLELPELAIEVDDAGRPVDCAVRERNRAHVLIEEAMLAANRAVASALDRAGRPTLHRVHLPPPPQKLSALALLLEQLGLEPEGELEDPRVLAGVLERVKGTPSEERIHMAALRSMSQARYALEPRGHHALQFEHYLHFTSPIRRYADLEVHRALKRLLAGVSESKRLEAKHAERSARLAIWLSGRERLAVDAERDAAALACCALLSGREGESFGARVTAASEFGLFVRLDSPAASGLVPIRTMEGEWIHDPEAEVLRAPRSGARIGLGDAIEVRLMEVDSDRGRLAFTLVQEPQPEGLRPSRGGAS
ncbi:MAG: ribonuclease R family protein [bacterium]